MTRVLGMPEVERHDEFIGLVDPRRGDLDEDGDQQDDSPEVDETVGDAPGTVALIAEAAEVSDEYDGVRDY